MCKIRIIFKNEKDMIVDDVIYQFDNLEISPIDRPSYLTCRTDESGVVIGAYFTNDAERFSDVVVDDMLKFNYGDLSGRIKYICVSNTMLYDTTIFRCIRSLPDNLSRRVFNNINEYLKLYGHVLELAAKPKESKK